MMSPRLLITTGRPQWRKPAQAIGGWEAESAGLEGEQAEAAQPAAAAVTNSGRPQLQNPAKTTLGSCV